MYFFGVIYVVGVSFSNHTLTRQHCISHKGMDLILNCSICVRMDILVSLVGTFLLKDEIFSLHVTQLRFRQMATSVYFVK